jgi:hypothetical protein
MDSQSHLSCSKINSDPTINKNTILNLHWCRFGVLKVMPPRVTKDPILVSLCALSNCSHLSVRPRTVAAAATGSPTASDSSFIDCALPSLELHRVSQSAAFSFSVVHRCGVHSMTTIFCWSCDKACAEVGQQTCACGSA